MSNHDDMQERDDLGSLRKMVEAVRADAPDDVHWQSARSRLAAKLESRQSRSALAAIAGMSRRMKLRWAVPAAVAAVAVAILIGWNPWTRSPQIAFAQVAEQLREAQTLTFKMTVSPEGCPAWVAEMAFKRPGRTRMTTSSGRVVISDVLTMKSITLSQYWKLFTERDLSVFPPAELQKNMSWIETLQTLPDRADKTLGRKKLNGRTVEGFHVAGDIHSIVDGASLTVWVDVATRNPVQIEATNESGRWIMTGLRFDVDLDDSLFDLTPPEGYGRHVEQRLPPDLSEEDLIQLLRVWGTNVPGGLLVPTAYFLGEVPSKREGR